MEIFENIFDVIVFGTLIASVLGVKRPLFSAVAGAIILPLLHYLFAPFNGIALLVLVPIGYVLGFLSGFAVNILFSGLKGKSHSSGPSYMGGFGGGRGGAPPGGIILSDDERKGIKK